jgi:SAM-dependent methyltransferase
VTVHEVARQGFGSEATTYERSRPGYPPEAVGWMVEHLRLRPGTRCIDLAAGTGKLTRLLQPTGTELVAIEPVAGMWGVFREMLPGVPLAAGAAEALPLVDRWADAVTVAQAFHWFDADRAFAELRRVLRPWGRVGLIWNARDRSVDWVDKTWAIMDTVEKQAPWRDHENWRDSALGRHAGFGEVHTATFHHVQELTHEGLVDRFRGVSHVATLPPGEQKAVLDEVRTLLRTHVATKDEQTLSLPYRVDAYWCERA